MPLNLCLLLISILVYLGNYIDIDGNIVMLFIMGILSIYYYMTKNKILTIITYIIVCILNVINIFVSLFNDNGIVISLILVSTIVPFVLLVSKVKDNKKVIYPYIYCLLGSYLVLINDVYDYYLSFITCIGLYLALWLVIRKDKLFSKFTILFTLLPIITLIGNISLNLDFKLLLINIVLLGYIVYFLLNFIKNNIDLKSTLFVILTSILFIIVLFNSNFIFGIYIGIISLFLLIYSSIKDNLKIIFIYSLVLFIINILYRLRDMWSSIPLWTYLLFAGLSIIVFATIKEIKKSKK